MCKGIDNTVSPLQNYFIVGLSHREFTVNLHGRAVLYTGAPGRIVKALRDQTIILSRNESEFLIANTP